MLVVFFVLYFYKGEIFLITGKRKLGEQWLGLWLGLGLFFVWNFSVLYSSCCIFTYGIYILDSEITLTIQNIDVTQENTAQLRSEKKEIKKKLHKILVLNQNVLEMDKIDSERENKLITGKINLRKNANHH